MPFTSQTAGDANRRRWDERDASQPRSSGRFSPPSSSAGSQAQARLQPQGFSVSSRSLSTPERSTGSVLGHSAGPPASVLGRRYSGHYQDNGFDSRSPSPPPPGRRGRRPRSWSGSGSGSGSSSGNGSGLAATPTLGQPDPSRFDEDGALGDAPVAPPAAPRPRCAGRLVRGRRSGAWCRSALLRMGFWGPAPPPCCGSAMQQLRRGPCRGPRRGAGQRAAQRSAQRAARQASARATGALRIPRGPARGLPPAQRQGLRRAPRQGRRRGLGQGRRRGLGQGLRHQVGSDQPWSAGEGLAVEREGRALTSDSGGDYDGGCDSNDDGEWLALPGLPSDSSGADAGSGGDGSDADTGSGGSDGSGVYVMV